MTSRNKLLLTMTVIAAIPVMYMLKKQLEMKAPDKVLDMLLKGYENVTGSYIIYEPETVVRFGQTQHIYRGEIQTKDGTYEFTADAYTGDLIDSTLIHS